MILKKLYFLIFIGLISFCKAQSVISGIVMTEEGARISQVVVLNIATDEKVTTNTLGEYKITANYGQQLRFIKERFERNQVSVSSSSNINVVLIRLPQEIESVEISKLKISGDISKDASQVRINQSKEELRQAIGLPRSSEKPREKPPEIKHVLLPLIVGQLNVDALYKLVSGKSKQMKRLYRYQDEQEYIQWMRTKIDVDYFESAGIPEEHIDAFLLFCLADAQVLRYVKAKNTSGLIISIENNIPTFLFRIK